MSIRSDYTIDDLRSFLVEDRIKAAYQLGNLNPANLPFCKWYGYEEEGRLVTLFLYYTGLRVPTLFTLGDDRGADILFNQVCSELPRIHVNISESQRKDLRKYYKFKSLDRMVRMYLRKEDYVKQFNFDDVFRLGHSNTASIMKLYQHYPDHFFEPSQLEMGLYFGVRRNGELISIAGLHVLSEDYDVAAIGNLVTHSECRKSGYALRCTARLLDELFKRVSLVTLNVAETNKEASCLYRKFGFQEHNIYLEGHVTLRT